MTYANSSLERWRIAERAKKQAHLTVVLTHDQASVELYRDEINFFLGDCRSAPACAPSSPTDLIPVFAFPDWETLPYDRFSPHEFITSERLKILAQLKNIKQGVLIVSLQTALQKLPPTEYLAQTSFFISLGQTLDLIKFRQELDQSGYRAVSQVMAHGEFAVRGSIIDLYPMGSDCPYRLDLLGNEIDSIREFDAETQRTLRKINKIELLPAHELPMTEEAIDLFRQKWGEYFQGNPMHSPIYNDVIEGHYFPGIEYYLPLFFENISTLFNYLPKESLIIRSKDAAKIIQESWKEITARYELLRHDSLRPILPPEALYLSEHDFFENIKIFEQSHDLSVGAAFMPPNLLGQTETPRGSVVEGTPSCSQARLAARDGDPAFHATPRRQEFAHSALGWREFFQKNQDRVLFCAESLGRQETLIELLTPLDIHPIVINSWQEFLASSAQYCLTTAPIAEGFHDKAQRLLLLTESMLFGERAAASTTRRKKSASYDTEGMIRHLAELKIGDPVVHIQHGIGRFMGLQTLSTEGFIDEYMTIGYANGDKLYVPIQDLNCITRYTGADPENAPLYKLGGSKWEKTKKSALQKIGDVAAELLHIYALRASKEGVAFSVDKQVYRLFCESFPFDETPDQAKAIEAVLADLQLPKPMDRLICGDVGFGKTEVAMRAAFVAVSNKKQVAILVPTTLLCQQHTQNFKDRFATTPIRIEALSRFQSSKNQQQIKQDLKLGKIDIVIGTHALLQPNLRFNNLGLLIIDEEHRFGVVQKEKIKALRANVHVLTLTATPIPRTLNMAFAGLRDLSLMATPPERRLSIKTFLHSYEKGMVKEAVMREILRGGQVYFVYNQVESMALFARELAELLPEARIQTAHGQMPERDLERIMLDFYHRKFNVLICTTIIESGIDIPSANTIIIYRADRFGLSQLHQLRGRVGRSTHQAYAYLFIHSQDNLTADAKKRLDAFAAMEELGIGFSLATHDMEIRGAGELLGDEQSGHIHEIGFELYNEMLGRAVAALKSGKVPNGEEPLNQAIEIRLPISAFIPHEYIPDIAMRLILYKRLASLKTDVDLLQLREEMIDRFGRFPEEIKNLFALADIKKLAINIGILSIIASQESGIITFQEKPNINPDKIIRLIQISHAIYQLAGPNKIKFKIPEKITALEAIKKLLKDLQ